MAALLALVAALAYGTGDFFGGLAARRLPSAAVVLRSNAVGLLGLLVALPIIGYEAVAARDLAYGALGGIAGAVGVLLLYRGLSQGAMSLVAPITAALSAIVPVTFGIVDGERPSALGAVGIPLALVAIVLLSRDPDGAGSATGLSPTVLATSIGSGFGFGLFFVAIDHAGDQSGLWPVVAGRAASVSLFAIVALVSATARVGGPAARLGTTPALLVACGLLDAGANALFLLATHHGMLTLVAVIGALYPASTLLLARIVLDERLARPQLGGVALAGIAVVLVSAG
jgi:uncharacterized membrane protein